MAPLWWAIAKAEYYVSFSKYPRRRTAYFGSVAVLSLAWALFILPWLISLIVDRLGEQLQAFLIGTFPGVMRSVILMLWIMLVIFPIAGALAEVKIGQWEIILSQNVSTRALLLGTFVGRLPVYGLVVLVLAPVLITPFTTVYQVSILGQLMVYGVILISVFCALWISTLIGTAIQAKLGESSRGNDIAKGLGMLLPLIFLIPFYGLIYFAETSSSFMGMDLFLLLPSTWSADLITWIVIKSNGLNLSGEVIAAFESFLGFPQLLNFILLIVLMIGVVVIGIMTTDRLFDFRSAGGRSTVTTIGHENIILRSLRQIIPGSFGVLVVTTLKDFTRKVQNLSKFVYGLIIAIVAPILQNNLAGVPFFVMVFQASMMMGMMGGITFGGIGFMDSQDQLWIIKGAPKGVVRFVKARLVEAFLFSIPLAVIPAVVITTIVGMGSIEGLMLFISIYTMICGSALVGIGITANNPTYEDTKSGSFSANMGATFISIIVTSILSLILAIKVDQWIGNWILTTLAFNVPLLCLGTLICFIGTRRLIRSENV